MGQHHFEFVDDMGINMSLPTDAVQMGGIVAVAIAALRLVEILVLRIFGNGSKVNRVEKLETDVHVLREIITGKDDEGALLLYYPRRVYNAVDGLAQEFHKMHVILEGLAHDVRNIHNSTRQTSEAVRQCEALNRMREVQHVRDMFQVPQQPPNIPPRDQ